MREKFFKNFEKVWSGLGHFLNFLKILCGPPLFTLGLPLCPPPFAFDQNVLEKVFLHLWY